MTTSAITTPPRTAVEGSAQSSTTADSAAVTLYPTPDTAYITEYPAA
ncbi:hypothetical protein [Streptomyces sp. NPDC020681]